jgi:transposase-like protein
MSKSSPFKWRHFEGDIILLCVRWYLRYALSYRDPQVSPRFLATNLNVTKRFLKDTLLVNHFAESLH